jgi:folate-dependent phosphoribosylglycinamide formyltransferase PurN
MEAAKRLERHLEEIATKVATKDTMTHFVNAGMEVIQAANVAMKQLDVPEETKIRIHKAEKEVLLAMRSAIDAVLTEVEKEIPPKKAAELKKIEIRRKAK